MEQRTVVIIGGGMSGLIAGIYLRMNGFRTEILEMHDKPGGLCTSWERKGYTIDGCIHWLVGSSPTDNFYNLWKELIRIDKIQFVDQEVFLRAEDEQGNFINVYSDIHKLKCELLQKAPEDKDLILELCHSVEKFTRLNMPNEKAPELYNVTDGVRVAFRMIPYLGIFRKFIKVNSAQYASQFKNNLLRKTIEYLFVPEMAVVFLFFTLAWLNKKSAGYPIGGSLKFAQLFEQRYLELGGKIRYKSRVSKILTSVENGKQVATGVQLNSGESVPANHVISAADAFSTLYEMLGEAYVDEKMQSVFKKFTPFPSYLQLSLGIKTKLDLPATSMVIPLGEPVSIDPQTECTHLHIRIHDFDPTLTPAGHSLITALIPTRNETYWANLRTYDFSAYKAEKSRVAVALTDAIKNRFGLTDEAIEMQDISSPATVLRYTNNWQGSFEGWLMTPETGFKRVPKTLKKLDNFYLCGQWVEPGGGLPSSMLSGRNVAQILCKKEKVTFRVIPPK